jgi:serine/threonine protein kinase
MEYIASKGLVHCDLAARNILLCGSFVAKISNFGRCYSSDFNQLLSISSVKNLETRWLAPEVLTDQIFSEKSDVWSFGIVMFEMFTFGKIPYDTLHDGELLEFLQSGHHLECPNNLNNPMDQIIISCWHLDPEQRPTFKELEERFYKLIELFSQVYEYV